MNQNTRCQRCPRGGLGQKVPRSCSGVIWRFGFIVSPVEGKSHTTKSWKASLLGLGEDNGHESLSKGKREQRQAPVPLGSLREGGFMPLPNSAVLF